MQQIQDKIDYEWVRLLNRRLSKAEVGDYARRLHHDEQGIASLLHALHSSKDKRIAGNAAWILSNLGKTDKEIYLSTSYDEIADFVMTPNLKIRRGLVLSILFDMPVKTHLRIDLFDFCLSRMMDKKESDSTRSMMIKFTAKICSHFPDLANELILNLELLSNEMKPSISCASKNALNYLNKLNCSRKILR